MRSLAILFSLGLIVAQPSRAAEPASVVVTPVRPAVLTRNFGPTTTPEDVKWRQAVADEAYQIEPVHWRHGHGGWHVGLGWHGPAFGYYSYRPYYAVRPYVGFYGYRPYYGLGASYFAYRPYYYSFGGSYFAPSYGVPGYYAPRYVLPRPYSFYAGPAYAGCYHW